MGAVSKPSRKEAENFHVLPKRDAAKEQGRKQESADLGNANIQERDVDAGSLTGDASQVNQPQRDTGTDRSQVS
jgi:hypothetical protein